MIAMYVTKKARQRWRLVWYPPKVVYPDLWELYYAGQQWQGAEGGDEGQTSYDALESGHVCEESAE